MGDDISRRRMFPKDLPSYQWEHNQVHWREGRLSTQYRYLTLEAVITKPVYLIRSKYVAPARILIDITRKSRA
jgi:hypothetical protein